jgi:thymidylate synthase (FAD)
MTQQTVELIDHMGDDLRVVNAARVSFDKESAWEVEQTYLGHGNISDPEPVLSYADDRLLRYLAKHKHFTPFTHNQITLRETVPIFVARQRFKHVVGFSYNEVSRRYVSSTPDFYTPKAWRQAAENVKQGSGDDLPAGCYGSMVAFNRLNEVYNRALAAYHEMLANGVCAEQARMVLPQGMLTSYYVTGSLAAFARAYGLRKDPHAQAEIRDLAAHWDRLIRPLFPQSWSALVD